MIALGKTVVLTAVKDSFASSDYGNISVSALWSSADIASVMLVYENVIVATIWAPFSSCPTASEII